MTTSLFRKLSSVALAACLVAASSAASAAASADVKFDDALVSSFNFFGVTISASGPGTTYVNNTFSSPGSNVLPGATTFTWTPTSALTFTIAGNGSMTFDGLVYDNATSTVSGDVHFVNGAISQNFNDVGLFSVSGLTPAFSTLSAGGSVAGTITLSAAGLGGVAAQLGITVPIPTASIGTIKFTATPVPEPESWALGLAGGLGVFAAVRRRRHA